MLLVGGHRFGIVFHLVFVFFLPLCQFRVAVASSWFFGDEGLPCIFNFELFLKDDNFSQLFCGQFVLVFVLDVVLDGFEVVVEGIAAFEGVGSVDFEEFEEINNEFVDFVGVDGGLFGEDVGDVLDEGGVVGGEV